MMTRLLAVLALLGGALLFVATPAQTDADANPRVRISTNAGDITVELYPDEAPLTVANFLSYVDSGFYAGTVFHRVIPNFMIQGGGFTQELAEKPAGESVKNESRNHLHNERGSIAMARTDDPDSAGAQFFINVRANLTLDFNYVTRKPGYTVFGRVIDGMDVVDGISLVNTQSAGHLDDVPVNPIVIESITRLE
ncbi:MAG: peptidylprolyl isomerase [Gammaproteobacteria bacterium]|jgi:peptidyl-prolyl cis-trans isomerase A (cyclophilin A)/peptidyl-prolyl cis-trans isomerase B (cyclophilin B)|nr:peptidylprolyl isomerase [Gammaproteobacteria bacterium]MBK8993887.1 peptidylprolyl isomerase [Gammaproteobacteria bacterium]